MVIGVTQLVTALILVHGSMTFLADVYRFFNPPGGMVWLFADNRGLSPVDGVVSLNHMVVECSLAMFRQAGCALIPGKRSFVVRLYFDFVFIESHTDQCLNFSSHHLVEHKLSLVGTLLDRSKFLSLTVKIRYIKMLT